MCITERNYGEVPTLETRHDSHEKVNKQLRYKQIIEVLKGQQLTAKEIANAMYFKGFIPNDERNFSAPRLTELMKQGVVEQVGKKKCAWSGKTVTIFALREDWNGNHELQ